MFFQKKDELIEAASMNITRAAEAKRQTEKKEESTKTKNVALEETRVFGPTGWVVEIKPIHPARKFWLECVGTIQSYEFVIRQALAGLRAMARRGWSA